MYDKKPLLTIAIPTYNRAAILKKALQNLLPQINRYKEKIEFVISDNASSDNTQEIIKNFKDEFCEINFITNLQSFNTGYFGNFKKCRELSHGKFFWLLSDNEHLFRDTISFVMNQLSVEDEITAIYLHSDSAATKINYEIVYFDDIKENHNKYGLMLISSLIFLNNKTNDEVIFSNFINNLFLGFFFFCTALKINKKMLIAKGSFFESYPCSVSFDIFKAWIEDACLCVNYMVHEGILTEKTKSYFIDGYLKRVVYFHVYHYLTYRSLFGKGYGSPRELQIRLDTYYGGSTFYDRMIAPLFKRRRIELLMEDIFNRLVRKTLKLLKLKLI